MMIDIELSRFVAAAMRPRPKDRDCYLNAFLAICAAADAIGHQPRYVEGLADSGYGFPVPHAWLEAQDGRVIDVTPTYLEEAEAEYEPKHRYTIREVRSHLAVRGATLPINSEATLYGGEVQEVLRQGRWRLRAGPGRAARTDVRLAEELEQ